MKNADGQDVPNEWYLSEAERIAIGFSPANADTAKPYTHAQNLEVEAENFVADLRHEATDAPTARERMHARNLFVRLLEKIKLN